MHARPQGVGLRPPEARDRHPLMRGKTRLRSRSRSSSPQSMCRRASAGRSREARRLPTAPAMSPPRTASPTAATTSVTLTGRRARLPSPALPLGPDRTVRARRRRRSHQSLGTGRDGGGERRRKCGNRSGTGDAETDPNRAAQQPLEQRFARHLADDEPPATSRAPSTFQTHGFASRSRRSEQACDQEGREQGDYRECRPELDARFLASTSVPETRSARSAAVVTEAPSTVLSISDETALRRRSFRPAHRSCSRGPCDQRAAAIARASRTHPRTGRQAASLQSR
jgi:hypothetical protein